MDMDINFDSDIDGGCKVKICGLKTLEMIEVAIDAKVDYIGFVFYEASPRAVTISQAAELARHIPSGIKIVGLFVDPDHALLDGVLSRVPLDMIQLHGSESPEIVIEIGMEYHLPILKAIPISSKDDLLKMLPYQGVADMVLFDAKPPENVVTTLPGGNGIAFDWSILEDVDIPMPWMLSGGLNPDNVAKAIEITGATTVDVSSGVEIGAGIKDAKLINDFVQETCHRV